MQHTIFIVFYAPTSPVPSPPSAVSVSQNGPDSVIVSWTPPSETPDVTGYIIYYQQDGGQRLSENAGATATTATITGLITGATYSISMVATSSMLLSTETTAQTVIIGNNWTTQYIYSIRDVLWYHLDKENIGLPNSHCK